MASAGQNAEGSKRSISCEKRTTGNIVDDCTLFISSVTGMPGLSDADDAYLRVIGPSVPLQMPGEHTKCFLPGLMWLAHPH